jgi:hypothetical protein
VGEEGDAALCIAGDAQMRGNVLLAHRSLSIWKIEEQGLKVWLWTKKADQH